LLFDGPLPAPAPALALVLPFQEIHQQDAQPADQLPLFAASHAFDFFDNIVDVGMVELAVAQQRGLLVGPGVEIAVVEGVGYGPHPIGCRQRAEAKR
jgi:hypothetical protein